jgi:hypothetical protein
MKFLIMACFVTFFGVTPKKKLLHGEIMKEE